jgi:hypothetical protein
MSTDITNTTHDPYHQNEIDRIFNLVWETAVHRNPMVLVKMLNPDSAFKQLRGMIQDCLANGLSATGAHEQVLNELLQSSAACRMPRNSYCRAVGVGTSQGKLQ